MSKVAKTQPVLDKSIEIEDDYLKSRRALRVKFSLSKPLPPLLN